MTLEDIVEIEAETPHRPDQDRKAPPTSKACARPAKLAAECLDMLIPHVQPGVRHRRARRPWPASSSSTTAPCRPAWSTAAITKTVCISPNHVVCHGIPGDKALREGDIANIDVTVIVDGWHGDTRRMYGVGEVGPRARRLVDITHEAHDARPGRR